MRMRASARMANECRWTNSTLSTLLNDSLTALSRAERTRPMLWTTPSRAHRPLNSADVYSASLPCPSGRAPRRLRPRDQRGVVTVAQGVAQQSTTEQADHAGAPQSALRRDDLRHVPAPQYVRAIASKFRHTGSRATGRLPCFVELRRLGGLRPDSPSPAMTARPGPIDLLGAANAVHHGLTVLHVDNDLVTVASVIPELLQRDIRA
jgi:hypothetical protein